MNVSVCTVASGRGSFLANMIKGLRRSCRPPGELIVTFRQHERRALPETSFPVRGAMVASASPSNAAARNAAARQASGRLLVFLDESCVPDPTLIEDYILAASTHGGILMGNVGYLPEGACDSGIDIARFRQVAVAHPDYPSAPSGGPVRCTDPRLFAPASFAIRAEDYAALGGFDEGFQAAGLAGIDFARAAISRDLPLWQMGDARAYCQFHVQQMPPVDQCDEVLADVDRFVAKWGEPVMDDWLRIFKLMGLVRRDGQRWIKLHEPTETDLALVRQPEGQRVASSQRLLRSLEDRTVLRIDQAGRSSSSSAAA